MKWYVCCPPHGATGGTELLHQAACKLRGFGIDAEIYYYVPFEGNPVAPRFEKYAVPWVASVADSADNVVIVPEAASYLLYQFPSAVKVLSWLSVDNFYASRRGWRAWLKRLAGTRYYDFERMDRLIHAVQSHYATDHLATKGITDTFYLSDYLGSDFITNAAGEADVPKEDVVLYNPRKGVEFTQQLMAAAPDLTFFALDGMTPLQLSEKMRRSKVYIDFGNHPGKDRIPREAAVSGCCVVTGRLGSAAYQGDVPIPDRYKFDQSRRDFAAIRECMKDIFTHYAERRHDFDAYRRMILAEEARFDADLKGLVDRVAHDAR